MNILVADDDKNIGTSLQWLLNKEGHDVKTCRDGEQAIALAGQEHFDVAFMDVMMPGMSGIEALTQVLKLQPHLRVYMISGQADIATAVKATKLGACDFLEKPLNPEKLILEMRKLREQQAVSARVAELQKLVDLDHQMLGDSPKMRELREMIERAAPSEGRIMIYGENGSGKELVAREIHLNSLRKNGPFIQLNCAAIPRDLIESELFGYEKGSFTGAVRRKQGLIEQAEGGTLLLDEVGDMALETQAKLLRVLQENEFTRLGGAKPQKFDVRIISATNKNLLHEISQGYFREDLYFRLNVIPIVVPPLREHVEDIPLLIEHFAAMYSARNGKKPKVFSSQAIALLKRYNWPGNIRELKNIVERLGIMISGDTIGVADVGFVIGGGQETGRTDDLPYDEAIPLKEYLARQEKAAIMQVYHKYNGNVSKVAQVLQTDRANLHKKLKTFGIKP
ncbi:MAG TPA: sigma-54 dependent transcriptional regulator [bacterium]|nr:sigma-54 dependent transcriptional regulator [bacterium]HPN42931.1 sigma-54 dependent transcriptional regulator [bacterium]